VATSRAQLAFPFPELHGFLLPPFPRLRATDIPIQGWELQHARQRIGDMLRRFWTLAARGGSGWRGVGGLCGVRGGYLVEARGVLVRGLLRVFIFRESLFCFGVAALCRSVDQVFLVKCEDMALRQ
jgi:hypothetical protein